LFDFAADIDVVVSVANAPAVLLVPVTVLVLVAERLGVDVALELGLELVGESFIPSPLLQHVEPL